VGNSKLEDGKWNVVCPLITQLRFEQCELVHCLMGVTAEEAIRHFIPMNCISWIIELLASQENFYLFHLGEVNATRQLLGRVGLPQFVGNVDRAAYHPGRAS
jgi:hypothetical protein